MTLTCLPRIAMVLLTLIVIGPTAAPARAAEDLSILLTADLEGKALSCDSCPSGSGGGLARMATAVAKLRQGNPNLLLLDAGNALIGSDSVASGGGMIVAAYGQLGYDAVNLSYRDFRLGKADTLAVLKDAKFPVVSANLLDDQSGTPLAKPYIVKSVGGQRVAVIGVADLPAALAALPHIQRQLAGIRVQPVAEALASWLPKAKAEADKVVLLYYGSAEGLAAIRQHSGKDLAAILVGGVRPEELPADAAPPLVGASDHGRQLTLLALGEKPKVSSIDIDSTLQADPAMQKVVAPFIHTLTLTAVRPATTQSAPAAELPTKFEAGKTYALGQVAQNRAAKLTVSGFSVADKYGELAAPVGQALLVVQTEWENIIPLTLANQRALSTMYQVPTMGDHLYLLVNGRHVVRLHPKAAGLAGHISVTDFQIKKIGEVEKGNAIFELPAPVAGVESLELRFYDYAHGHIVLPLLARPKDAPALAEKPVSPVGKNAVLEAGAYQVRKVKELAGKQAPADMTFVVVDLRARSLYSIEVAAGEFDPKAAKGAKTQVGAVADWKESRKYIQLIADGEYAYPPLASSSLDAEPRLLPDLMTGGDLVFLAPDKSQSLELHCEVPNTTGANEAARRPAPIVLALEGKRPELPKREAQVEFVDDMFTATVFGQNMPEQFAGSAPPRNTRFLVLDVSVSNSAAGGDFFQAKEQVKYTAESGAGITMHAVTEQALHPASENVWVPGGQRRTFQMVFAIPAKDKRPRVMLTGSSSAKVFDLKPLAAAPVAPEPPAKPAVVETPPALQPQTKPAEIATPPAPAAPTTPAVVDVAPATQPAQVEPTPDNPPAQPAPEPTIVKPPDAPPVFRPATVPAAPATSTVKPPAPAAPAVEAPAKPAPRFCTHCGGELKPGAKFCSSCGAKVGE